MHTDMHADTDVHAHTHTHTCVNAYKLEVVFFMEDYFHVCVCLKATLRRELQGIYEYMKSKGRLLLPYNPSLEVTGLDMKVNCCNYSCHLVIFTSLFCCLFLQFFCLFLLCVFITIFLKLDIFCCFSFIVCRQMIDCQPPVNHGGIIRMNDRLYCRFNLHVAFR